MKFDLYQLGRRACRPTAYALTGLIAAMAAVLVDSALAETSQTLTGPQGRQWVVPTVPQTQGAAGFQGPLGNAVQWRRVGANTAAQAQGMFGGSMRSERRVDGNTNQVRREGRTAFGGTIQNERVATADGSVQSRTSGTTALGYSYDCVRAVARTGGGRAGQTTCVGPAGQPVTIGSQWMMNAQGGVTGTVTGPGGQQSTITSPAPNQ
ncbi:MAG: hypothetical protein ACFB6R_10920 [Alphaproteobacteria bacterium]